MKEEGDKGKQEEEGQAEKNLTDRVSINNAIDVENTDLIEIQEEEYEDIPPPILFSLSVYVLHTRPHPTFIDPDLNNF